VAETHDVPVEREVTPLELLFDLVFVFAVSQLSHHLLTHLTWTGAAETAVLLVAVFGVWAFTSFDVTLLDDAHDRTRVVLLVVMGLGLYLNAAISHAFSTSPWQFVVTLLAVMLGIAVVMTTYAGSATMRGHYRRLVVWTVVTAPLWIAGAAAEPGHRLWWWGPAALVDVAGTWLAHPLPGRPLRSEHHVFDADHMVERLRLFLLIVLGETVLTIGRAISEAPNDVSTTLAAAGVFVTLVCLWAAYFDGSEEILGAHLQSTADPIRSVRLAINAMYVGLAGLVAVAVGAQLVIEHPRQGGSAAVALLLCGGCVAYVAAQAWFFRATAGEEWRVRLLACAALVVIGVLALWAVRILSLAPVDVVLVALVLGLRRLRAHPRLAP
jgi:low temperature requirement protein LtrA